MPKRKEKEKELLERMRKRFQLMYDADSDNRQRAMDDMSFATVPGSQWDDITKEERGNSRPCYEYNKLRINGKKIINEIRDNRPGGKVIPTNNGSKDVADIKSGLIRNILNKSHFDTIIDYEAEFQVFAGMCAWRVTTDYEDDEGFGICPKVELIANPFGLYCDPFTSDPQKRDADDWVLTDRISHDEYKSKYPDHPITDINFSLYEHRYNWITDESVRIAEYWYKEPYEKEIWQLQDGKVIDAASDEARYLPEAEIKKRRTIESHKIMMFVASGDEILEGPAEWAGSKFPFVQVYGEYYVVEGKPIWYGLTRWAKDPQRSYNVSRTSITERMASSPLAKFWATPTQADGLLSQWAVAHKKNYPFRLYNPDPAIQGPPIDSPGPDVPMGLVQEAMMASKEIDDVTGIYQDDRGDMFSQSGVAVRARQSQGRIATFNFQDNITGGVQLTWEILLDLIPRVYDTEQEIRILGSDDAEDYKRINTFVHGPDGPIKVNDLTVSKDDVLVTAAPSWQTRRQEAAEVYQSLTQSNPSIFPLVGDLVFKSMDLPYSDEISDRLKTMLPQPVKDMIEKEIPPEIQHVMQQANEAMKQAQMQVAQAQQAAQEIEREKSQNAQAKAEVNKLMANVKAEEANFKAKISETLTDIAEQQFKIDLEQQRLEFARKIAEERNQLDRVRQEFDQEKQELAQFSAQAVEAALAAIAATSNQFERATDDAMVHMKKQVEKPKIIRIDSKRVKGKLQAVPIYEEEGED